MAGRRIYSRADIDLKMSDAVAWVDQWAESPEVAVTLLQAYFLHDERPPAMRDDDERDNDTREALDILSTFDVSPLLKATLFYRILTMVSQREHVVAMPGQDRSGGLHQGR